MGTHMLGHFLPENDDQPGDFRASYMFRHTLARIARNKGKRLTSTQRLAVRGKLVIFKGCPNTRPLRKVQSLRCEFRGELFKGPSSRTNQGSWYLLNQSLKQYHIIDRKDTITQHCMLRIDLTWKWCAPSPRHVQRIWGTQENSRTEPCRNRVWPFNGWYPQIHPGRSP